MITNLQVLRWLAALGVVFYHTGRQVDGVSTDFFGVAVFFVISGFIMTYIVHKSADDFFIRRLIRIVPIYWICTIFFLTWNNIGLNNPLYVLPLFGDWIVHNPGHLLGYIVNQNLPDTPSSVTAFVKSLLFIPYLDHAGNMHPLLGVGWTLNLEMFFYAIFAVALRVSRRWAPLITIIVIGLFHVAADLFGSTGSVLEFYAHPYTTYFALGIVTYYVWTLMPDEVSKQGWITIVVCAIAFIPIYLVWTAQGPLAQTMSAHLRVPGWLLSFGFPAILVFLMLVLHNVGIRCNLKWPVAFGDASYALYLSHLIIVGTLQTVSQKWAWIDPRYHVWSLLLVLASTSLFALAIYQWVERPMIKAARSKWGSIKSARLARVVPDKATYSDEVYNSLNQDHDLKNTMKISR